MKTWYSCKIRYGKQNEDGSLKQVTDAYLLDAVSYTDAEARIHDVVGRELPGEFAVTNIGKTNIEDVVPSEEAETWFKCKVTYATVSGNDKEVKVNTYLLVCALHVKQAFEKVEEFFAAMLVPYDVPSITQTNFVEVYPYISDEIPANLRPVSEVAESDE